MIKYLHELSKEEFLWLVSEYTTYEELGRDFPQPPWCNYYKAHEGCWGCWSLNNFDTGRSRVTGEDFCKKCDCYLSQWKDPKVKRIFE